MKTMTADWPKALVFLALLLLSLSMGPHKSLAFTLALGILLLVSSFWAASSALRERRRAAKAAAEIVHNYVLVVAVTLLIALGWFLVCGIVAKLFA
jgi:hypothetical protein